MMEYLQTAVKSSLARGIESLRVIRARYLISIFLLPLILSACQTAEINSNGFAALTPTGKPVLSAVAINTRASSTNDYGLSPSDGSAAIKSSKALNPRTNAKAVPKRKSKRVNTVAYGRKH